jgi:hypothetical protein
MMSAEEEVVIEEVIVEEIIVVEDEHTVYEVVVNATRHELHHEVVSYEEIVKLAFPTPPTAETRFTVTFRGAKEPKEGSLKPSGTVTIRERGAIFNVTATTKS